MYREEADNWIFMAFLGVRMGMFQERGQYLFFDPDFEDSEFSKILKNLILKRPMAFFLSPPSALQNMV